MSLEIHDEMPRKHVAQRTNDWRLDKVSAQSK